MNTPATGEIRLRPDVSHNALCVLIDSLAHELIACLTPSALALALLLLAVCMTGRINGFSLLFSNLKRLNANVKAEKQEGAI